MSVHKVLIVEDDKDIRELLRYNLTAEGYHVIEAADGEQGLKAARSSAIDLVLLDLMLPGVSGLEICKALKGDVKTAGIPIVMVTAKGAETDIVVGLELGAADYVVKPFSPKILVARVKAVLRRNEIPQDEKEEQVRLDNLDIHVGRREARVDGVPVTLTYTEFQVLHLFASRPGWVFTRYQIVNAVKGDDYPVTDRSVDVQIVGLRKKLGSFGKRIETVRGVGYRLSDVTSESEV